MTDEQIEKAAQQHADKQFPILLDTLSTNPWPDVKEFLAKAYKQGAQDALSYQWIPVEEELPDESEEVLCMMKSNGAVVSGFIFRNSKGKSEVATDSSFHFEDYEGYEPTHWMHKPLLNNNK